MSIRRYLKPINGLPDPRGSLSANLPSAAIASANREVEKVTGSAKKRGPYKKYVPNVVASNTTSQLLLAAASHLEHDTARGATCSINAHHARIVKFFVQFDLYENILTRIFFTRKFSKRKKNELRYVA